MLTDNLNWLDLIIAVILFLSIVQGIRTGLIRSVFSIAGIILGLFFAVTLYTTGSELLLRYINLPPIFADAVSFIFIFSFSSVLIHMLGSLFSFITRISLVRLADKAGGSVAGLFIGLTVVAVMLILLTAFPVYSEFQDHLDQSFLAPQIVDNAIFIYDEVSDFFSLSLPRLTAHPENIGGLLNPSNGIGEHYGVNFKGLDGAECFVCGGPVEYLGYLDNNKGSKSPKFICRDCGRTSDGCQTYEGYHQMYHQCPVELGNIGYRLDCGIWINHSYHRPLGPCPVCGIE